MDIGEKRYCCGESGQAEIAFFGTGYQREKLECQGFFPGGSKFSGILSEKDCYAGK